MKKRSAILGLVLAISSVSHAFCLKQYSRNMNRYTASMVNEAVRTNYALYTSEIAKSVAQQTAAPVRRQK